MQLILPVAVGVAFLWLLVVSFFVLSVYRHYRRLTKDVEGANLMSVLEEMMKKQEAFEKENKATVQMVAGLEEEMKFAIQKVGYLRFNPFSETGGDQSFSVSLLDGHDSGFVLTGLHSRDRTRLYMKPVREGGGSLEFSTEEKRVIEMAGKRKK